MTRKMMPEKYKGKKQKTTINTSRNVKTVFFLGGGTRQIDRYMYTCMYVCMYVCRYKDE